jgi:hyperosmotically inducible protein
MRITSLRTLTLLATIMSPITLPATARMFRAQQTTPPPDNTGTNKQSGPTADQQSQTKADLALVQKIRQAIIKNKTLSTDAHNCKVITQDGAVTLRGPVNSAKEKDTVGRIALSIAGAGKVTNELVVKAGT